MCPESGGCKAGTVDGTPGVWKALGINLDIGVVPVTYTIV
jgi:hypothetical protein